MTQLASKHDQRLTTDPDFVFIQSQISRALENRSNQEISLNEEKLLAERAEDDTWRLDAENKRRAAKGLPLLTDTSELDEEPESAVAEAPPADEASGEEAAPGEVDESDPYLVESGRILLDLIDLQAGSGVRVAVQQ
jgi:carboxyl-terminal processing protease